MLIAFLLTSALTSCASPTAPDGRDDDLRAPVAEGTPTSPPAPATTVSHDLAPGPAAHATAEPTLESALPPLPTRLGPLALRQPPPQVSCYDSWTRDGSTTCRSKDAALLAMLDEALGMMTTAAVTLQTSTETGLLTRMDVFVAGCYPSWSDLNGAKLLKRYGLSALSYRRSVLDGWVARQDGAGTRLTISPEDDNWCALTLTEGAPGEASDATRSDGELQGLPVVGAGGAVFGHLFADPATTPEAALLMDDGMWASVRQGDAESGSLRLQRYRLHEGTWLSNGPPLVVETPSWGTDFPSRQTPPNSALYAIGDRWLIIETDQRSCQSGADTCHVHRAAQVVRRGDRPRALGRLPVDIVGALGHETCEGYQVSYRRALAGDAADELRLSLSPWAIRTLCDANLEGCVPSPARPLEPAHPLPVTYLFGASAPELVPPDITAMASGLAARPRDREAVESLVSLAEVGAGPGTWALSDSVRGVVCALPSLEPASELEQRALRALAKEALTWQGLDPADRARLEARLEGLSD